MLNVTKFWQAQGKRIKITDMPTAISDGFIIDFRCPGIWDSMTPDRERATFSICLTDYTRQLHLVSEGMGGSHDMSLYLYRFKDKAGEHLYIQKQYAEYFIRKYPGCTFNAKDGAFWQDSEVAVMSSNEIVGAICPTWMDVRYRTTRKE